MIARTNATDPLLPGESRLFILYHLRRMWPLLLVPLIIPLPSAWAALGVSVLGLAVYAVWQHVTGNLFFSMVHVRTCAQGLQQLRKVATNPAAALKAMAIDCSIARAVNANGRVQLLPLTLMPMVEHLFRTPPEMAALLAVRHIAQITLTDLGLPNVPAQRIQRSLLTAISSTPATMPSRTDLAAGLLVRCLLLQSNVAQAARLLVEFGHDEMLWLSPDDRLPRCPEMRQRVVAELTTVTGDLAKVITQHRNYRKGLRQ